LSRAVFGVKWLRICQVEKVGKQHKKFAGCVNWVGYSDHMIGSAVITAEYPETNIWAKNLKNKMYTFKDVFICYVFTYVDINMKKLL
jgi:hypothetical protein